MATDVSAIQTQREFLDALHLAINTTYDNMGRRISIETVLHVFMDIVSQIARQPPPKSAANPNQFHTTSSVGIVFFSDRILIHSRLFGRFVDWDFDSLEAVLRSGDFGRCSLTNVQFANLQNASYVRGSKFDWHSHRYPPFDFSEEIIRKVMALGGESFYLASDQLPVVTTQRLTMTAMMAATIPPTNPPRLRFARKSMAEILSMYASDIPPAKCWLLYLTDDEPGG
jgi:hypothetical protein